MAPALMLPAVVAASADETLRGAPLAVYLWLLCHRLDVHTYHTLKVEGLAASLRMKRHTIHRALRLLVAGGYLERKYEPRTGYTYRLRYTRQA